MNKENLITVAVAVVASVLVVGVFFAPNDGKNGRDGADGVGAIPGSEVYAPFITHAGHVDGGISISTTTAASATLEKTDVVQTQGYVRLFSANVDNAATLTLPASSTLASFIPNPGQCFTQKWENTGDSNGTIAAGTGIELQEPTGGNVIIGATDFANVEWCRQANTDIVVTVTDTIPAD